MDDMIKVESGVEELDIILRNFKVKKPIKFEHMIFRKQGEVYGNLKFRATNTKTGKTYDGVWLRGLIDDDKLEDSLDDKISNDWA